MVRRAQSESEPAYTEDRTFRGPSSTSRSASCLLTIISVQTELKISCHHIHSLKLLWSQFPFLDGIDPITIYKPKTKERAWYYSSTVTTYNFIPKTRKNTLTFLHETCLQGFPGEIIFPSKFLKSNYSVDRHTISAHKSSRQMSVCSKPFASYICHKSPHISGVLKMRKE